MAGYTQEFLIGAFLHRYRELGTDKVASLRVLAERCYIEHGKDKFRVYASLDAAAIREYKQHV